MARSPTQKKLVKALAKVKASVKAPNTMFPGRPNYTGPQTGYFAMVHHQQLFEECTPTYRIKTRVDYVKRQKPTNEVKTRLHNLLYLGKSPHIRALVKLIEARTLIHTTTSNLGKYELLRPIDQAIDRTKQHIRGDVIAYIAKHIPDHAWREAEHDMEFPDA